MMNPALPWFCAKFPLYLAPMAGVSDKIFRQLCKEYGADVLTTEFVSAEGIFRRNERTRQYLDFDEVERPIGVQLFGGHAEHMAEAARALKVTPAQLIGTLSLKLLRPCQFRSSATAISPVPLTSQNDATRPELGAR